MDVTVNGKKIGEIIQKRSAEQYAKEYWLLCELRKFFKEAFENSKNVFKTPIIKDEE
jgi:hypothetical protein